MQDRAPMRFGWMQFCRALPWFLLCWWSGFLAAADRPNVLFIAVDDLKPMLGCYGDKTILTPNIDRLAARGVVFERAYANQAVCAPSRNSLLTGRRPQSLGIYDLGTNFRAAAPDAVTLPQAFQRAGYRTEAVGKIFHVGHGNHEDPASWTVPHWPAKSIAYLLPGSHPADSLTREEALFSNAPVEVAKLPRGAPVEAAEVEDNAYPDGQIADEVVSRLQAAAAHPEEPRFLAVGFVKPHLPFCAPKKYWDLYDPERLQLAALYAPPEGAPKFAPTTWGELRQYSDIPISGPVDDATARKLIHGYHAAVSYVDAQIGRVLDALDTSGLAEKTIIVLWGDHGWHLGDHGMWSKHTNYEEAAHLPLIISAPGEGGRRQSAGAHVKHLVETVDIYPTLCKLAGIETPREVEGRSFVSTLQDPQSPTKDAIIHVFPRGELIGRAIRTERYRLVEWKKPGASPETAVHELYDYEAAPLEPKNLASTSPEIVDQLRAILARFPEAKAQIGRAAKPPLDRGALFSSKDGNKDGHLSHDEFMAGQADPEAAAKRFQNFDTDGDGVLSREEFVTMGRMKP